MNAALEHLDRLGVAAITGSPREVRRQLEGINAEKVVAFAVPHGAGREAGAIVETLINIAPLVHEMLGEQRRRVLETIIYALVPKLVPEPIELKEAAMLARARTAVLGSGYWMTAPQIAQVAGYSATNPGAQPGKWKRQGAIFAIRHNGADYYPSFGLDPDKGYRPLKAMAAVIQVLAAVKDGWGMAYWFQSANSFLGGKRPHELLVGAPLRVLAAAHDEVQLAAQG